MIVLDTNVVSETLRSQPDAGVSVWMRGVPIDDLYLTVVTKAELLYGLELMARGARRDALTAAITGFLTERLTRPILDFGDRDAVHFAQISASRRRAGRPIRELDAQIAAIARSRGYAVVTRNVRDFEDCGVAVINPWTVAP